EVRGHFRSDGDRAASEDHAIAFGDASGRAGGRGHPGRTRDSQFDAFASFGQVEERRAGERAAGEHVFALYGEYGGAPGIAAVPVLGVLHAEQGVESAGYRGDLRVAKSSLNKYLCGAEGVASGAKVRDGGR